MTMERGWDDDGEKMVTMGESGGDEESGHRDHDEMEGPLAPGGRSEREGN